MASKTWKLGEVCKGGVITVEATAKKVTVIAKEWDFYQTRGWMVGKNKMKDWKAAVRTWEKSNNYQNGQIIKIDTIRNNNQSIASQVEVIRC